MDPRIRPTGRWFDADPRGQLINDTTLEHLPPAWVPALRAIVLAYQEHIGSALHSVWVRGSAVRGGAVLDVSDLDTLALADLPVETPGTLWVANSGLRDSISVITAPGCTDIEADVAQLSVATTHPRGAFLRFLLATQSCQLLGDPFPHRAYTIGPEICFAARALPGCLRQAQAELPGLLDTPPEVASLTRWVAKTVVRAGLDLVLERHGRYTRDLWLCYATFREHYPENEPAMAHALEAAIFPSQNPAILQELLLSTGPWLLAALEGEGLLDSRSSPEPP